MTPQRQEVVITTHVGLSPVRRVARTRATTLLVFGALLLTYASTARAHTIEPTGVKTVQAGERFEVAVVPSGPDDHCKVLAKVSVDRSDVVNGGGKKKKMMPAFKMEARKPGVAVITIQFDGVGKHCPAVQTGTLTVTVVPRPPPEYATTTLIDFTAKNKKGKDFGAPYGIGWQLDGITARSGTWTQGRKKNRCTIFKGGDEMGSGYGTVPGRMIGKGRIQGRFIVDPKQKKGVSATTSAGVEAIQRPEPGQPPPAWGMRVRWGEGTMEVFSYTADAQRQGVVLAGTSVEVAVEFTDDHVSYQYRVAGANSWTELDRLYFAELPDDTSFVFWVQDLQPGGLVCVDDVVATNTYLGPAEKAICKMLADLIALQREALEQVRNKNWTPVQVWLSDAIKQIFDTSELINQAASGIENPDNPQGPKVSIYPQTHRKLEQALLDALASNRAAYGEAGKSRSRVKVAEKHIKAATDQILLALCHLHALNVEKPKDLPKAWRER